jgi:rubrerythrin
LLDLVDDPDAKALLQSILSDEEKHEQGLRALKQRVLQQEEQ